jgi:putative cell wall-binding protein
MDASARPNIGWTPFTSARSDRHTYGRVPERFRCQITVSQARGDDSLSPDAIATLVDGMLMPATLFPWPDRTTMAKVIHDKTRLREQRWTDSGMASSWLGRSRAFRRVGAVVGASVLVLGGIGFALPANAVVASSNEYYVSGSVSVPAESGVTSMAVDPLTKTLYSVIEGATSRLSVVDTSTNLPIASVPLTALPEAVAVDATRGLVYVTSDDVSTSTGNLLVFSASNNALVATISLSGCIPNGGDGEGAPAIDTSTGSVFIPCSVAGASQVDEITAAQVVTAESNGSVSPTTIPLPTGHRSTSSIAVNSSTGVLYVAAFSDTSADGPGALIEYNADTDALIASVPVGEGPTALAIDATTGRVYVAQSFFSAPKIAVVDSGSTSVNATIALPAGADSIAMDSTTGTLVAGTLEPYEGGTVNELAVINTVTGTVAQTIPLSYPGDVALGAGGTVYAASAADGVNTSVLDALGVSRVSGADRYATSVQVAHTEFPGTASVVYVASGENYPDALSAGPAAVDKVGPVLLTDPNDLTASVAAEISALKPGSIVIVGGTASVSAHVETQLKALAPKVTRESGADRYATSQMLVKDTFATVSTVYIATGANFPDALSAGAAAGSQKDPLLLVDGSETSVDAGTAATLKSLTATHLNIDIVGGTASISAGLAGALAKYGTVKRLPGADRYATAEAVNENAYSSASNVVLATGSNFPDALSATAWAGSTSSPLFLSQTSCVAPAVLADIHKLGATQATLVGGPSVLTQAVATLTPCS